MAPFVGQEMIRIAFRFDDLSQTSDHTLEKGILEQLANHGLVASFAVEPFTNSSDGGYPLLTENILHLVDANRDGAIEIAMHGFTHKKRNVLSNGIPSEFAGLPEAEQLDLIQRGASHLRDVFGKKIHGFVPPWNTYDQITLRVLDRCGFSYVSAGWESLVKYHDKLQILPGTCNLSYVQNAVKDARRFIRWSPVILVIMHHYDFSETGNNRPITSLEEFDSLLAWINLQDDVQVQFMAEIAAKISIRHSWSNLRHWKWKKRLNWRLQAYLPGHCFTTVTPLQVLMSTVRGHDNNSCKTLIKPK